MKKQIIFLLLTLLCLLLFSQSAWPYAHEDCPICHGNRLGIGLAILTKERKIATINPNTGKPLERIEAICLSCHSPQPGDIGYKDIGGDLQEDELAEEGAAPAKSPGGDATKLEGNIQVLNEMMLKPVDVGFQVIDLHQTHPVGIVPRKVKLPPEAKGFKGQEEQLTCMGCHNHHPSNPNYKYLRWPAGKGDQINKFCANCHKDKVRPEGAIRRAPARERGFIDTIR
ncbi:MAG: hypothetical protein HZA78_06125 [Candidatus Schekmanbacteria bacterium]|nr:hypothetical protein [Candidatus Schekmanbacteria bacterium]